MPLGGIQILVCDVAKYHVISRHFACLVEYFNSKKNLYLIISDDLFVLQILCVFLDGALKFLYLF